MKIFDKEKFTKELLKQHWEYVYFFAEDPNAIHGKFGKTYF